MIDFYSALRTTIQLGEYALEQMEDRINRCWLDTRITTEQRDELLTLAAECAKDEYQIDVLAKLGGLDLAAMCGAFLGAAEARIPAVIDGFISAAQNIVGKFASLLKENLYNSVFMMVGYREGTPGAKTRTIQSNETLRKIYMVFSLFGLIGDLLPASVFLFDNYRGKRKEAILKELEEMRARRAEAALAAEEVVENEG